MDKNFEYKNINENQKERIDGCKNSASFLMTDIETHCPNSREKAIAKTKLEECVMWLSKAISHEEE